MLRANLQGLLAQALNSVEGFKVVGEAGDAKAGIELCEQVRPQVVLLDSILPGQQGPDAVARVLQVSPCSRVLMVSGAMNPLALRRALGSGARGFVPKSAPLQEMIAGIRTVHSGRFFYGTGAHHLMRKIIQSLPEPAEEGPLTGRERDVLAGIAQGSSSKEIAGHLGLSVFTVENHRRRIMDRTGVRSIAGLTLLAVELGLVTSPRHETVGC